MERGLRSLTGVRPTHAASSFADDMAVASFTKKRKGVTVVQAITHTSKVMTKAEEAAENERVRDGKVGRISRKSRNRLLGIAFGCLLLDALISFIFCLLAPNDPRLDNVFASRQQLRTVSIQGIVAVLDALISAGVVVHVVAGILSASLDHFLEAAATKLLQAIFFSLLQTGYPTFMRLAFITVLLLLRVATAALILRAAFLSGVLNVRPSADLPKVIVSLLEMGAPVANTHLKRHMQEEAAFATDRPLTFELMERLVRWLVPLRERAAAAGMGRRQVLLISAFIILMTGWMAFYEYWSILGDQGEFFVEGQLQTIEEQSFAYLAAAAYAVGQSARTVGEARSFLPYNVSVDRHRVVAVVLSGLRYDAFEQFGDGDGAALARWRAGLDSSSSVLCKLQAEVPTLAVPNWVSLQMGVKAEIHGLLGNRGPPDQEFSSIFEVMQQLQMPAAFVGTPWHVDLLRSALEPFEGDGSVSASLPQYEDLEDAEANTYDLRREKALLIALNSSARLVVAQLSQLNTAGYLDGVSYAAGSYAQAVRDKAALLDRVVAALGYPGAPPTTLLVFSEHGQLSTGGAGGGSSSERDVPLLAYRMGSRLGDPPGSGGAVDPTAVSLCEGGVHSVIDVPSTIAGLLNVPVPRHCQGTFIEAIFDSSRAAPFDPVADVSGSALLTTLGPHGYRRIEHWQWKDLYFQRHAWADQFLLHPDVNRRSELDSLDTRADTRSLLAAAEANPSPSAGAYKELFHGVNRVLTDARDASASSNAMRNQAVALFILVLVLSLVFFAMQVQTFCDPLVVVTCSAAWRRYPDTQAALVTFALVVGYYVVVVVSFVIFLRATGQPWSSSVVAISDNVLTYLLITLLPGVGAVLIASRVLLLLYAQWPQGLDVSKLQIISFVLVDEIQAFRRIELLYLGRFYLLLWSLIAAVILGVLASRFSFIVPLLFYNKYVNAALWDFRFSVMTVQVMTVPLLIGASWFLYRWPATRVDLQSMAALNELKVAKAERRRGEATEESGEKANYLREALLRTTHHAAEEDDAENGEDGGVELGAPQGMKRAKGDLKLRFEEAFQEVREHRQAYADTLADMQALQWRRMEVQSDVDEILSELQVNQNQIDAGIKALETLIVRRFEEMHQADEEAKAAKTALLIDAKTAINQNEVDDELTHDPAARREMRRMRLVEEQRRRIAEAEAGKAEADAKIRTLQAELTKLIEANRRLQNKLEMCEHTVDETRDAIEDMSFQISQCAVQKENALAVLSGETNYLTEHQIMVQRKASELGSKMAEVEAFIAAAAHKLQRVHHSNELSMVDRRREIESSKAEAEALHRAFEQSREDVRVLYGDKLALYEQLKREQADAAGVEQTLANYRKSAAHLLA